jgi:type II secretory ATPase GspE/PulE/Tfp pilus assembly ATPase PilB-like protein
VDEGFQSLILKNPSIEVLQSYLKENGQETLKASGYKKVLKGITTMEEVQRVASIDI